MSPSCVRVKRRRAIVDDGSNDRTADVAASTAPSPVVRRDRLESRNAAGYGYAAPGYAYAARGRGRTATRSASFAPTRGRASGKCDVAVGSRTRPPAATASGERYETSQIRRLGTGLRRSSVLLDSTFHDATRGCDASTRGNAACEAYTRRRPRVKAVLRWGGGAPRRRDPSRCESERAVSRSSREEASSLLLSKAPLITPELFGARPERSRRAGSATRDAGTRISIGSAREPATHAAGRGRPAFVSRHARGRADARGVGGSDVELICDPDARSTARTPHVASGAGARAESLVVTSLATVRALCV